MKQIQHQRVEPHTHFDQQYFPVYGPRPVRIGKLATLRQAFRYHWLGLLMMLGVGLFCMESIRAFTGYGGGLTLQQWGCEILATLLLLLTLALYRRFRQWGQERTMRKMRRIQSTQKADTLVNQLNITPPPLTTFLLTIDYWASREAIPISEYHYELAQLPDEFIAPDALILNIQLPDHR